MPPPIVKPNVKGFYLELDLELSGMNRQPQMYLAFLLRLRTIPVRFTLDSALLQALDDIADRVRPAAARRLRQGEGISKLKPA